ncbi:hypothetical protein [Bacterioplanoides sp.]|uniref:hypothetical protein n=1 Tax=Bacterioplanoides sp. TaxID=2066072 RepID=UPI003B003134
MFPFPDSPDPSLRGQFLGCSLGGRAVSMWGECHPDALEDAAHLGVEVTLDELDEATRSHILARIEPVLTT